MTSRSRTAVFKLSACPFAFAGRTVTSILRASAFLLGFSSLGLIDIAQDAPYPLPTLLQRSVLAHSRLHAGLDRKLGTFFETACPTAMRLSPCGGAHNFDVSRS